MNITYWIIISVLLAIVFIIILPPLWKKREVVAADSDQRNIKIAQERLSDLEQQLANGALTQQQFDEQYGELELTLGDDLAIEQTETKTSSLGRWVAPIILVCVPLFSVLTYFSLGEPDALKKAELKIKPTQHASTDGNDINSMVMRLAQRLKEHPENANDWVMLGRSFKYLKQYKLAANSFKKAYDILGDDPKVMLQYADSLAMANGGKITGKASEMVFKALEKSPNDVTGLWLAGMSKAETGDLPQAISYWKKLETILPPDSGSYKEVQNLISTAQAKISGNPIAQSEPVIKAETQPQEKASISVSVQVSIAESITSKTSQNDTVFVYAKALTGPPMPLAIVRKQVSDLPLSVTLDDSMAMMPTMKLSSFKAVKIMARVSKSGNAMQQKGDLIGELELKELAGNMTVAIIINKEI